MSQICSNAPEINVTGHRRGIVSLIICNIVFMNGLSMSCDDSGQNRKLNFFKFACRTLKGISALFVLGLFRVHISYPKITQNVISWTIPSTEIPTRSESNVPPANRCNSLTLRVVSPEY